MNRRLAGTSMLVFALIGCGDKTPCPANLTLACPANLTLMHICSITVSCFNRTKRRGRNCRCADHSRLSLDREK